MKLKVVLEIEFSELPDSARQELADGINFRADDDETFSVDLDTVPRVSEMEPDEVKNAVRDFFSYLGDYDSQEDHWAGSEVYGFISECDVIEVSEAA